MKTIWKYQLPYQWMSGEPVILLMPAEAEILRVDEQRGVICLWALVDTLLPSVAHFFQVVGTGHSITAGKYMGTAFMESGLVWHVLLVDDGG